MEEWLDSKKKNLRDGVMCQGCKKATRFGFRGIKINHTNANVLLRAVSPQFPGMSFVCNMVLVYEAIYFQYVYKNPVSRYAYSTGSGKWNSFVCSIWLSVHSCYT